MRRVAFIFAMTAAAATAMPAHGTDVGPFGGPGGAPGRWQCPQGYYINGLSGRVGQWTDSIWPSCLRWPVVGQSIDRFDGQSFGTSKGGHDSSTGCSGGTTGYTVVGAIRFMVTRGDNRFVQDISLLCRTMPPHVAGTGGLLKLAYDPHSGDSDGPYYASCPAGEVAVGLTARSGLFVDALGLICAPPAKQYSPSPTSKSKIPLPTTPAADFTGSWLMWLNSNTPRYEIFLRQETDLTVGGGFIGGGQSQIKGRIAGNQMVGQWSQGGRSGNMTLTMLPNGAVQGVITNLAASGGTWAGAHPPLYFPSGPSPGGPTADGKQYYHYPYSDTKNNGNSVLYDWCLEPGKGCGQDAADRFCAQHNEGKAVSFKKLTRAGRFRATLWSGSNKICDYPDCNGFEEIVCEPGGIASKTSTPSLPGGGGTGSCGPTGGKAVVRIPEPNLDRLNVRAGPGGKVIATVRKGEVVTIVGECGPGAGAGIAKKFGKTLGAPSSGGGSASPDWCQINAPVQGCVMAQYLVRLNGGGPGPLPPAAGLSAPKSGQINFSGTWHAMADKVSYQIGLEQRGSSVRGSFHGADGSRGSIDGRVQAGVLRFSWRQTDGKRGTGKFTLAADGRSFVGSYNFSSNPDAVAGSWNGTRQQQTERRTTRRPRRR